MWQARFASLFEEEKQSCIDHVRQRYRACPTDHFQITFAEWPHLGQYAHDIVVTLHQELIPVSLAGYDHGSSVTFNWPIQRDPEWGLRN